MGEAQAGVGAGGGVGADLPAGAADFSLYRKKSRYRYLLKRTISGYGPLLDRCSASTYEVGTVQEQAKR